MSDGSAIGGRGVPGPEGPRVLLFSMRNLARHVSRCGSYEFEGVVAECSNVDVVAPRRRPPGGSPFVRYARRVLGLESPTVDDDAHPSRDYDLFVAFVRSVKDLRHVERLLGRSGRCQTSVCILDELRPEAIDRSPHGMEVLSRFDCIFSGIHDSVEIIRRLTGRPCHPSPGGVDALKFCPYPGNAVRGIDVYAMGRRPAALHQALISREAAGELFYLYDTVSNFDVIDPAEHRLLLANLIKRSRYFITFPPKFDRPDEAPGERDLGLRFFEGAAGGSILLGGPPNGLAFREHFDWPDAVIRTPADGGEIAELIADLDRQPERLDRIRRDNVANSLRRHDWVYRWRRILETVKLPVPSGVVARERRLLGLAELVAAGGGTGVLQELLGLASRV